MRRHQQIARGVRQCHRGAVGGQGCSRAVPRVEADPAVGGVFRRECPDRHDQQHLAEDVPSRGDSIDFALGEARAQCIVNVSVAGDQGLDSSTAIEKMAAMAKLQKQAVAEAQQLARERQLEMQEELDAARAEAEDARLEARRRINMRSASSSRRELSLIGSCGIS